MRTTARSKPVHRTSAPSAAPLSVCLRILVGVAVISFIEMPRLVGAVSVPIDLCVAADIAAVVRAVRTFRYERQEAGPQPLPPKTVKDVDFVAERIYFGTFPPFVTRTFGEGTGSPQVEVGERHLFVFQERAAPGDLRLLLARYVGDNYASRPTVWERDTWHRLCREHPDGLFVGSTVRVDGVDRTVGGQ